MTEQRRVAVVTGASQGIGLEVARQLLARDHHVVLTARTADKAQAAAKTLEGDHVEGDALDVADDGSVDAFFDRLRARHGRIDVLVNNAGRGFDAGDSTLGNTPAAWMLEAIDTSAMGAWRTIRRALPVMNERGFGQIANVSSGMGSLGDGGDGAVAYRVSKTALNAVTVLASREAKGDVKVNAVCPGWVRTAMGGPSATRDVAQGAASVMWAVLLDREGPNGGFFRDGNLLEW